MQQPTGHSLMSLARQAILRYLTTAKRLELPSELSGKWPGPAAAFVSLKHHGELRGCIGTRMATQPTLDEVVEIYRFEVVRYQGEPV
jgi:AMMECR1 domain-containing protein